MQCFCSNLDYPANSAWALCDKHWNDQIAAERRSALDREMFEAIADLRLQSEGNRPAMSVAPFIPRPPQPPTQPPTQPPRDCCP